MTTITVPQFAPPGAGLPPLEHLIARCLFALRRSTGNRGSFTQKFVRERARISVLISNCDAAAGARRVLIRRPPGLEDSSRYWSVWMTLDHLRIVHAEMTRVIAALTNGRQLTGEASTAAVKPSPAADASVVADYEASCDRLLATAAAARELKTPDRFTHPWFGPLDANGWYALAGGHLGIHRVQIERILTASAAK
ncbi:MAG: DinB family protein [Chthoniobacteraceae bacterium]